MQQFSGVIRLLTLHCSLLVAGVAAAQSASEEFGRLSAAEEPTAAEWLQVARQARGEGDLDLAREALGRAEAGALPVFVAVELARIEQLSGNPQDAVRALRVAYDNGFTGLQAIENDPVLSGLKGNAEYEDLRAEMAVSAFPCEHDPKFREFDFWIGEWDVHGPNGQVAGSNVIRSEESGCVLTERWTGAGGGTGSSINFLDKRSNEWVQVWTAEGGTQIYLRGGMTEEGMKLDGEIHYIANGTTARLRGLWTPLEDGRVRQFFEQSNDDGKTWATWFEGFYTRREDGARDDE